MSESQITYEELMTELKKYERVLSIPSEQGKALLEARDKYNVSFGKIAEIFNKKYNTNYDHTYLNRQYKKLKNQ